MLFLYLDKLIGCSLLAADHFGVMCRNFSRKLMMLVKNAHPVQSFFLYLEGHLILSTRFEM